jgi:hypothetical protein
MNDIIDRTGFQSATDPIAMIFSATSCVMGSLRSFKRSTRKVCS